MPSPAPVTLNVRTIRSAAAMDVDVAVQLLIQVSVILMGLANNNKTNVFFLGV